MCSLSNPNRIVTVRRSKRRGLLASFTLIPEVENPYHYSNVVKWFITFIVAFAAATTSLGSAIIFPALSETASGLHSTTTLVNLSVALYMLSLSFCPLWWSAYSETAGRRTVYIASFSLFVLFAIMSAVAKSMGTFIAMRMICGGAGASVQAVGAGTLADIWEPSERGKAMGRFYIGPLCGPLLAPVIGGSVSQNYLVLLISQLTIHVPEKRFLTARWGWRSTQWFLVIYGGISFALLLVALPETTRNLNTSQAPGQQQNELSVSHNSHAILAVTLKTQRALRRLRHLFLDPLRMIFLLRHLPILFTSYYAALAFGSLYILNISIQKVFAEPPYGFSVSILGLCYIPSGLGFLSSALLGGKWADYIMKREAKRREVYDESGNLSLKPEDRMMENAWAAAVAFPAAMIWYGWTVDKGVFWVAPMFANFVFGLSTMLIFSLAVTMLTEFIPRKPSSGVAVANFLRNIFSCASILLGDPLLRIEGDGWMFTGLAILASSGIGVVWWMRNKGAIWREQNMDKLG
ncbi:hypothetical protein BB8028_0002g06160 [Beauveria bassiana]|uniref:Major facilitator superfamily (MFS) profile domain-containing protein n=1 Tax=Beauveria bassiana TaxID=176275 RepID=A0A2S7Y338_BEABA|nr:hypothetical protein BB8028_0002g06160 [Beauveria bassiana]